MGCRAFQWNFAYYNYVKVSSTSPPLPAYSLYSFPSVFTRPYSNIARLCGVVAQLPHSWRSRSVAKPHTYCQRKFLLVSNGEEGECSPSPFTYSDPPGVSQQKKSQSGLFSSTLRMINMRHTYCRKYWFLNKMTTQREERERGRGRRTQEGKINKEKLYNLLCNRQTLNVCVCLCECERAE